MHVVWEAAGGERDLDIGFSPEATMDDLVQVQVFCSDLSLYQDFNKLYASYFDGGAPARAFVGSGPLLFEARFEINGIAVTN